MPLAKDSPARALWDGNKLRPKKLARWTRGASCECTCKSTSDASASAGRRSRSLQWRKRRPAGNKVQNGVVEWRLWGKICPGNHLGLKWRLRKASLLWRQRKWSIDLRCFAAGNKTHLPHNGEDGGQSPNALLRVGPVEPQVAAVEEVRHGQLHADVIENNLRCSRLLGAPLFWVIVLFLHLLHHFLELVHIHGLIGADLRFVLAQGLYRQHSKR